MLSLVSKPPMSLRWPSYLLKENHQFSSYTFDMAIDRVNYTKLFIISKMGKIPNVELVFCLTGIPIKIMLSDGILRFHHYSRFLTALGREIFFHIYYTLFYGQLKRTTTQSSYRLSHCRRVCSPYIKC